jgi:hypothetical protein
MGGYTPNAPSWGRTGKRVGLDRGARPGAMPQSAEISGFIHARVIRPTASARPSISSGVLKRWQEMRTALRPCSETGRQR